MRISGEGFKVLGSVIKVKKDMCSLRSSVGLFHALIAVLFSVDTALCDRNFQPGYKTMELGLGSFSSINDRTEMLSINGAGLDGKPFITTLSNDSDLQAGQAPKLYQEQFVSVDNLTNDGWFLAHVESSQSGQFGDNSREVLFTPSSYPLGNFSTSIIDHGLAGVPSINRVPKLMDSGIVIGVGSRSLVIGGPAFYRSFLGIPKDNGAATSWRELLPPSNLEEFYAQDVNNQALVVGWSKTKGKHFRYHAVISDGQNSLDIHPDVSSEYSSIAMQVSKQGDIFGTVGTLPALPNHYATLSRWKRDTRTGRYQHEILFTRSSSSPTQRVYLNKIKVNDFGEVLGSFGVIDKSGSYYENFVWSDINGYQQIIPQYPDPTRIDIFPIVHTKPWKSVILNNINNKGELVGSGIMQESFPAPLTKKLLVRPWTPLFAVAADAGGGPHVKVRPPVSTRGAFEIFAYDGGFRGGVRVASGDITGDRVPDLVTAAGPGGGPHIKIYDGATQRVIREFFAYDPSFRGGVYVAAADVNGDGIGDVITGAGAGGGPHIKVFSGRTGVLLSEFFAFNSDYGGGVTVAAADLDGDNIAEIVAGTALGAQKTGCTSGGSNLAQSEALNTTANASSDVDCVRVFKSGGSKQLEFSAFHSVRGGVHLGVGDIDGSGIPRIIAGSVKTGLNRIKVFGLAADRGGFISTVPTELASVSAFDTPLDPKTGELECKGEVRVAAHDQDGDGRDEILAATGPGCITRVRTFQIGYSGTASFPFGNFNGGAFVSAANR